MSESMEPEREHSLVAGGQNSRASYAAARALDETYAEIRAAASTERLRGRMLDFDSFNALIGLEQRYADDERYRIEQPRW